tara:strand:- start:482 stop:1165 length:684 start_codon:yes stop_codon:yes gene_type:complete
MSYTHSLAKVADYNITDTKITDPATGWDVMSEWERPIMVKHAEQVCANGGHILESGFGLGISADLIQGYDIESHTIVEINDEIYDRLVAWAADKPNVIPVKGDWATATPTDRKYDGVFYDSYGDEFNKPEFPELIAKHCKVGTIVTWYNNILQESSIYSSGYSDIPSYWNDNRINYETVSVSIPDSARVKWYLEGSGNTYYAPALTVNSDEINTDKLKDISLKHYNK